MLDMITQGESLHLSDNSENLLVQNPNFPNFLNIASLAARPL